MSEWRAGVNAVRNAVDHWPALKLMGDMCDRIEYLEAKQEREVANPAQFCQDYMMANDVKPMPWQLEKFRKLGAR